MTACTARWNLFKMRLDQAVKCYHNRTYAGGPRHPKVPKCGRDQENIVLVTPGREYFTTTKLLNPTPLHPHMYQTIE